MPIVASDTIPSEIDAGLNLIKYCSLNDDVEKWAEVSISTSKKEIDQSFVEKKFSEAGYALDYSLGQIKEIYL